MWFDSGSSHLAVLNERFGLTWPADVYMEGGDQYRGWFHSSLLVGTGIKGGSPYRMCALNGWVLDGEGRAMHKSLGNVIEPDEIIKRHGAEILRLWTASVEFNEDVRLSETILTRLVDAYRKLRNTFRYLLGNLSDFDPAEGRRARLRAGRHRPVDSAARRRPGGPLPRVVREFRVPQGLSLGLRLRHGGPERRVFRRAQGPAVHRGHQIPGPAQRPDRALPPAGRAGAADGAAHELHRGRGLGPHGPPGQRARRLFPGTGAS